MPSAVAVGGALIDTGIRLSVSPALGAQVNDGEPSVATVDFRINFFAAKLSSMPKFVAL